MKNAKCNNGNENGMSSAVDPKQDQQHLVGKLGQSSMTSNDRTNGTGKELKQQTSSHNDIGELKSKSTAAFCPSGLIVVSTSVPQVDYVPPPPDERTTISYGWLANDEDSISVQDAQSAVNGYQIISNTQVEAPQAELLPDIDLLPKQSLEMFMARINSQLLNPSQENLTKECERKEPIENSKQSSNKTNNTTTNKQSNFHTNNSAGTRARAAANARHNPPQHQQPHQQQQQQHKPASTRNRQAPGAPNSKYSLNQNPHPNTNHAANHNTTRTTTQNKPANKSARSNRSAQSKRKSTRKKSNEIQKVTKK